MKNLQELLSFKIDPSLGIMIVPALEDNSKLVTPDGMFIALNRNEENRKNHVQEAISRGAKYILQSGEQNCVHIQNDVLFISAKNVRAELAHAASRFFPHRFDKIAAIAGTNGKSSTADIIRQIWIGLNINAASIGTLGVITRESYEKLPHNMTSPDCLQLHKILRRLSEDGITNIAMETSSQGIEQRRVDEIQFNVCAFTNFSQDHLDYHLTLENYWNAKAKLFSELARENSVFVVNSDNKYSEKIHDIAKNRGIKCVDYGYNSNDVKILDVRPMESGQSAKISFFGKEFSFILPLQGEFQIYNSLCAAATCYFCGIDVEKILDELQKLHPICGRLEFITKFKLAQIYIDYAHTPDALQNAILSLRNYTKNQIITVFGCGGDRDKEKRILMGQIAEKFSDVIVVTDDNPRFEDPAKIRKMILEGCPSAIEIENRKKAIEFAIKMLSDGDVLLIAGKGHETYQQIGKELIDFSDKKIVLDACKNDFFSK
ncbi:MAG: UDP-N-acetylmuramoyl-L-alanyl-D-glutamate--2,6-diaminopimelate ligase [Holosporaceae bacterium]|jgi:UDP-N-acetylmuramoyl-L-alanyl-D-glutamate--2,6-diaminopimelate ligase|nr:UDP-N-acetylmuramoyl-L-alanyl-D-glutamate--2,6-diaminopimelate ligase [Holosporaceae bacterium]